MSISQHIHNPDSFASQLIRQKAQRLVQHPGFTESDRPDIEQELCMELIQKYHRFDPKRARETTFIARVIEHKAVSLVRVCQAQKRHFRRNGQSLNESIVDGEGRTVARTQSIEATATKRHTGQAPRRDEEVAGLKHDIDVVLETLPADLKELAQMLLETTEYGASRQLGRSRRQVTNGLSRLQERFEDAGLREYL